MYSSSNATVVNWNFVESHLLFAAIATAVAAAKNNKNNSRNSSSNDNSNNTKAYECNSNNN